MDGLGRPFRAGGFLMAGSQRVALGWLVPPLWGWGGGAVAAGESPMERAMGQAMGNVVPQPGRAKGNSPAIHRRGL